jgi:very-short-patch-repair endonuclease
MNRWDAIREHYTRHHDLMMRTPPNEWAIDPYGWDVGLLHFTPIEQFLWEDLRDANVVIYPQYPVGRFFVDFGNPVAKVAIECDGAAYHKDKVKDAERDRILQAFGWSVYRIRGRDCMQQIDHTFDEDEDDAARQSPAQRFVQLILQRHRISRNTLHLDGRWTSSDDSALEVIRFIEEHPSCSAVFGSLP